MKIGDVVNYQNYVAIVVETNPLTIATDQGTTLAVKECECTLLVARSVILEQFSKFAGLGNIGGCKFIKGSLVICNDLIGYVTAIEKDKVCIVDREGLEHWVLAKPVKELSNPYALATFLYMKVVKGK